MPKKTKSPPTPEQQHARSLLGAALCDLRTSRRLSMRGAAPLVGVHYSTISHRESGSDDGVASIDSLLAHVAGLGAHLRVEIVDGPGDFSAAFERPASPVDPGLADIVAAWPDLDDDGRELLARALQLARAPKRKSASQTKQIA